MITKILVGLLTVIIATAMVSCCPTKDSVIRDIANSPSARLVTAWDTLYIPKVTVDTLLCIDTIRVDTPIYIIKDKLEIRLIKIKGSNNKDSLRISGDCKPDTIIVEKKVITVLPEKQTKVPIFTYILWFFAGLGIIITTGTIFKAIFIK